VFDEMPISFLKGYRPLLAPERFPGVRGTQLRIQKFCEKALRFVRNHETTQKVHIAQ
jgi:hypothetical protein